MNSSNLKQAIEVIFKIDEKFLRNSEKKKKGKKFSKPVDEARTQLIEQAIIELKNPSETDNLDLYLSLQKAMKVANITETSKKRKISDSDDDDDYVDGNEEEIINIIMGIINKKNIDEDEF